MTDTVELIFRRIRESGRGPSIGPHPLSGQDQFAWEGPEIGGDHTRSYFQSRRVRVEASNETARNVLARAIKTGGAKISWRMRTDAREQRQYFVNFRGVEVEILRDDGIVELSNAQWPN